MGLSVLIIIGVGVYFFTTQKSVAPTVDTIATTSTTEQTQQTAQPSLASLVAAGQPVQCSYAMTSNDGTHTVRTLYIANGSVRADSVSNTKTGTVTSHMIAMGGNTYVWTDLSKQGFKSSTSASASPTSGSQTGVDYNQAADYDCHPWTPDSSKFNLPTTISFTSVTSATPNQGAGATGAASAGVQGTSAQCGQCQNLPDPQKAQCLAALHC